MNKLFDSFNLSGERENFLTVNNTIRDNIDFKGTNFWILIFAIFIASLGLSVNSAPVIIGAMLISPLMGPIMGIGFGMAVNDLALLKASFLSYLLTIAVGLSASLIFFLLDPTDKAGSEILSRTSPSIYDALIAFFGGFAGILATISKLKGNVIPGVAIATALMPPLCTAGYGLASLNLLFFLGAFYLLIINTVFIVLATLVTSKLLKFPLKKKFTVEEATKVKRIIWFFVIATILASLFFGYDLVRKKIQQKVNHFTGTEEALPENCFRTFYSDKRIFIGQTKIF